MRMIPENHKYYRRKQKASISLAHNLLHRIKTNKPPAFTQAESRLKTVLLHRGIRFIDDCGSANVDAAYFTLTRTMRDTVWILWNDHPEIALEHFAMDTLPHLKAVIVAGRALVKTEVLLGEKTKVLAAKSMRQAVKIALSVLDSEGDVILSPATKNIWLYEDQNALSVAFKNMAYRLL